jgi:RNA polymerase sigma factor (sigma-70 family)
MVLRICRRMSAGDVEDADDLAQEVFLTLASRAPALKTRASIAGWLYRASWNVATRHRRDHATRIRHERNAAHVRREESSNGSQDEDVPFAVVSSELSDALSRALSTLPESYRDALVLHYFAGHTVEETAQMLGVKTGTAASWLSRGRGRLRAEMERVGFTIGSEVVLLWLLRARPTRRRCGADWTLSENHALMFLPSATASVTRVATAPVSAVTLGLSRAAAIALATVALTGTTLAATGVVNPAAFERIVSSIRRTVADTGTQKPSQRVKSEPDSFPSFAGSGAAGVSGVPEPSCAAILAGVSALALARRSRR